MNLELNQLIMKIATQFQIPGEFIGAERYGHGHINDTYLAGFSHPDGSRKNYIIQQINHFVFKSPQAVMSNITAITAHRGRLLFES